MKVGLKRLGFLTLGFAIWGCSSSSDGPTPANGGTTGASGSAGSPSGGGAGTTSAGSSAGGASGAVGGSQSGGSGTAGAPSGAMPNGVADVCTGTACPYGKCDNTTMAPSCTSVYPGPVGGSTVLCKGDGQYCLVTGANGNFTFWAVTCTGTVASAQKCDSLCGFNLISSTASCS